MSNSLVGIGMLVTEHELVKKKASEWGLRNVGKGKRVTRQGWEWNQNRTKRMLTIESYSTWRRQSPFKLWNPAGYSQSCSKRKGNTPVGSGSDPECPWRPEIEVTRRSVPCTTQVVSHSISQTTSAELWETSLPPLYVYPVVCPNATQSDSRQWWRRCCPGVCTSRTAPPSASSCFSCWVAAAWPGSSLAVRTCTGHHSSVSAWMDGLVCGWIKE